MPRTRSLAWSELKLGVLSIVALVIFAVTVLLVMGGKGFFWQRYSLKTRFTSVPGLKTGSPVRVAGKEVGSVDEVEFAGDQIDVTFQVNKEVGPRITTGPPATLGPVSLPGEAAVDIPPSSNRTPIPEWLRPAGKMRPAFGSDRQASRHGQITQLAGRRSRGQRTTALMTDQQLTMSCKFVATAGEVTRTIQQVAVRPAG